jgi:hypothetical protein
MTDAPWKFALLLAAALYSFPALSQFPADCIPGQAELDGFTAQVLEAGITMDEELLQKRKKAREADLARLKARYGHVQAAVNEPGDQPQATR